MSYSFQGKRVLVTGGTGSLGKVLVRHLLEQGVKSLRIFSRDEAKQYFMAGELADPRVSFLLGDIRNYQDTIEALQDIDIVFNAAALKQVPNCEYAPFQAVQTNIQGMQNLVTALVQHKLPVEAVVGISTDKSCKPVNVMGMTKALQERICIHGNLRYPRTRFVCTRYGNVLASRGSLIPVLHKLLAAGKPLTITSSEMTRFLMNLDEAANLVLKAVSEAKAGETFIPRVPSARIVDIANIFARLGQGKVEITKIRPGEKLHEILISEEEARRTSVLPDIYVIHPDLPPLPGRGDTLQPYEASEFSSASTIIDAEQLLVRLGQEKLLPSQYDPSRFN